MTVLVTGSAGFIGYHVAQALLTRGEQVLGVDNLNSYYDPALKQARLERLQAHPAFTFAQADVADLAAITALARRHRDRIEGVIHLAAQAGVRHSLKAPFDYVRSNLVGHMVMLETCRQELPELRHLVYASSSSVYGGNTKTPFAVEDPVDQPISLYAATKRADELLSHCYSHLYRIPATGPRISSRPAASRPHPKAEWMAAAKTVPERAENPCGAGGVHGWTTNPDRLGTKD